MVRMTGKTNSDGPRTQRLRFEPSIHSNALSTQFTAAPPSNKRETAFQNTSRPWDQTAAAGRLGCSRTALRENINSNRFYFFRFKRALKRRADPCAAAFERRQDGLATGTI